MTKQLTLHLILLPVAFVLVLTGCLSKPALVKQNYALATPTVASRTESSAGVLALRQCEVSPMFAGRPLVYRIGPDAYETDPYASFLVPPDRAIALPIRAYLRNSGAVKDVVEPGSDLKADTILEVHVTELYGDFRQREQPTAVLSLRLLCFDLASGGAGEALLRKEYSRRLSVNQNSAAAVVAGWNQALAEILKEFVIDLTAARKVKARAVKTDGVATFRFILQSAGQEGRTRAPAHPWCWSWMTKPPVVLA